MARPTALLALYLQFSIRYLNPRPGKTAIIIDHASNFKKFGYPDDDQDWKQTIRSGERKSRTLLKDPGLSIVTCDYCYLLYTPPSPRDPRIPFR